MNNKNRVLIISAILAVVISSLLLIVPITTNVIIAYIFSLFSILGLALSVLVVIKIGIKLPQDITFFLTAGSYLILNLIISVIIILLEVLNVVKTPSLIFIVIHTALFYFFVIKIVMLIGGKEHIEKVDEKVFAKTIDFKILLNDLDAIKERTIDAKIHKEICTIYDALRYSDPCANDNLVEYDNRIKESVILLENAVDSNNIEQVETLSLQIQRQIKDRNNRVKAFK